MTRLVWVVGAGGLLGSAVTREVTRRGWTLHSSVSLPWHDSTAAAGIVEGLFRELLEESTRLETDWSIFWVAGSGIVGTSAPDLESELHLFRQVLGTVGEVMKLHGFRTSGTIFFASSAGGVYAGSSPPPFTEATPPVPLSPYGEIKLRMESELHSWSKDHEVSTIIGRIANIYGPGQNFDKMQGLVSRLVQAQISPHPASIFVPLETVRDYIYVDDCAALICDGVEKLANITRATGTAHVTKIIGSGRGVTIASLLGHVKALTKRRPNVVLGSSPLASFQSIDLRLKSTIWTDLDARDSVPLPAGIHATMLDASNRLQRA